MMNVLVIDIDKIVAAMETTESIVKQLSEREGDNRSEYWRGYLNALKDVNEIIAGEINESKR